MKNTNNNNEIKVLMVYKITFPSQIFLSTHTGKKTLKNADNNNIYHHVLPTY